MKRWLLPVVAILLLGFTLSGSALAAQNGNTAKESSSVSAPVVWIPVLVDGEVLWVPIVLPPWQPVYPILIPVGDTPVWGRGTAP